MNLFQDKEVQDHLHMLNLHQDHHNPQGYLQITLQGYLKNYKVNKLETLP